MATTYATLYANFLKKVRSYELPAMDEDELKENLHDYMLSAIAQFDYVCRQDLADRDDEAEAFNVELSADEVEILGNYMVLVYLDSTYIRTPTLLKANLSSNDLNAYSPANMLDKLNAMQERFTDDNETMLARYGWTTAGAAGSLAALSSGYRKH